MIFEPFSLSARRWLLSLGAIVLIAAPSAAESLLFTTQEDFTGWTGDGLTIVQATPDFDGATDSGLAEGGAPGTGGSLGIGPSAGFQYFFSDGQQDNTALINALGTSGTVSFDHDFPTALQAGSYFQLAFVLNYNNHFDQYFGGSVDNGDGTYTTSVDYEFSPGDLPDDGAYLTLGLIYNAELSGVLVSVDNIRVASVPEPASTGLALIGLVVAGVASRRR